MDFHLVANDGEQDSGKLRLTQKVIEKLRLKPEEYVLVTLSDNTTYICRVSAFSSIIEEGCTIDRMISLSGQSCSSQEIINISPLTNVSTATSVSLRVTSLNPSLYSFSEAVNIEKYIKMLLLNKVICENCVVTINTLNLQIVTGKTPSFVKITNETKFEILQNPSALVKPVGYQNTLETLSKLLQKKNCGILLLGEHGSGKSTIAKYCASQANTVRYYPHYQITEDTTCVDTHIHNSVVILDDIDELLKDNSYVLYETIKELLLHNTVLCISTKAVPPVFKGNLLTEEYVIPPPDVDTRFQILETLRPHHENVHRKISKKAVGYLANDLVLLENEVNSRLTQTVENTENQREEESKLEEVYLHSMTFITPSVLIGSETDYDRLSWDEIGGLQNVKEAMTEAIEWPMLHKERFQLLNIRPSRGVLLYGPSGCAKTSVVRATATMLNTSFITLNSATIYSPFVGDAEASVRDAFRRARSATPCIIFIDEIDTVVGIRSGGSGGDSVRDRVLSTMLNEMDGVEEMEGVVLVAASNRKDLIDPALLRPGRFDCLIEIPKPDLQTRVEIFNVALRNIPVEKDIDVSLLAQKSEGMSGADIKWVVSEACTKTLREDINAKCLSMKMMLEVMK
ncbi:proteasome-activating nucleotidase, putative [Entamoeba invadens IP1]|uniref:Proteasome-activating nucleotidase, putative n=1 Tax=Entamoeba invadens IP1 TaxID=370355 RepID=A0A0A1U2K8_ENTIV|nr:proteasome-activating nucleotidase, putative [Entamoeba invadens IP1]ELP85779.1 proteasome-activating nucleotidase, putative [Entamoeba invadens IP1]|eukprot:XP_004185125.1 proteasome-activating nucleotidase, putative [Entamoeba invadens IP1]